MIPNYARSSLRWSEDSRPGFAALDLMCTRARTSIYLVCYHSTAPDSLRGSEQQYRVVDVAVRDGEWPYDNGDDPSFYVARRGGPLTWGVCREDLRNGITKDSIVVFFSFTPLTTGEILYRLCAVATVYDKLDHRAVHRDRALSQFRRLYINGLIAPERGGWRYDETDRRPSLRHKDWLWRLADHGNLTKAEFENRHSAIYQEGWLSHAALSSGQLVLADNYIHFSSSPDRTFIAPYPPEVAIAVSGRHEKWIHPHLRELTVGKAASLTKTGRDYLRSAKASGGYVHRQIRFEMPIDEANRWRDRLIAALKDSAGTGRALKKTRVRANGTSKC